MQPLAIEFSAAAFSPQITTMYHHVKFCILKAKLSKLSWTGCIFGNRVDYEGKGGSRWGSGGVEHPNKQISNLIVMCNSISYKQLLLLLQILTKSFEACLVLKYRL